MAAIAAVPREAPRPVPKDKWSAGHPRTAFLIRRLGRLVVSLAVMITLAFAMIHLIPGDPVRTALGPKAPHELIAARRHTLWLDRSLWEQYVHYLHGLATGDLGTSITSNVPVSDIISARLPSTAELAGIAFVVIMLIAVPGGMIAAILTRDGARRGVDLSFTSLTSLLATIPGFLFGIGLVVVFGVTLRWFPVGGKSGPESYVLPVAALSVGAAAALARIVRAETLAALGEDYVRTARSKELPARLLYLRHVLPNMLTGTLTLGGLVLAGLIGGTVLVENVFAWPGIGTIVVSSINTQDYPVAQAIVLMLGVTVLVINAAVDLLLGLLDPRSTIGQS